MKKSFFKNAIIVILIIIILMFSFMFPKELSKYQNKKYLSAINEITYDNVNENIEELEYVEKVKILSNLFKKDNVYYSDDKNIQITTNDSILEKNEMSLDQIITYINSQIREFFNYHTYISYNVDYSKSTIESKYIKLSDKTDIKKYMAIWDITFKVTEDNYLNIVIDSVSGKIYGIIIHNDNFDFSKIEYDYKKIYLEYSEYLNLNDITEDILRQEKDKYLKYDDYDSLYKSTGTINVSINLNSIVYSLFNIL